MKVKRYVVENMPEAMQKIRADLGADAVILSSKEIRVGGVLGLFGKKRLEVLAAADTQSAPSKPAAAPSADASAQVTRILQQVKQAQHEARREARPEQPPVAEVAAPRPSPVPAMPQAGAQTVRQAYQAAPGVSLAAAAQPPAIAPAPVGAAAALAERERADRASAPPQALASAQPDIQKVMEELREMRRLVARLAGDEIESPAEAMWKGWRRRLLAQDVSPDLAKQLVEEASESLKAAGADPESADEARSRAVLESLLLERMSRHATEPKGLSAGIRVAHFVGPTGVGKTTSIAKLAAEQVLHHRRKVGFITADTYRIAAVEQLRTYASILNVPMEVVVSPHDLAQAFAKLADRDLIFMDTAGRNYRNPMYVSELSSLLRTEGPSETYLVLSLTAKGKDMMAVAETFSAYGIRKLMLTKLDETDSVGGALNVLASLPYQLDYVTNGQNVPDDIRLADERELVRRLLEDIEYE